MGKEGPIKEIYSLWTNEYIQKNSFKANKQNTLY